MKISGNSNVDLIRNKSKNLQESSWAPLEVSHDHLLITPPSHFTLQKVRDWVVRFFVNEEKSTVQMVAGLQILSSGFLGSGQSQNIGE